MSSEVSDADTDLELTHFRRGYGAGYLHGHTDAYVDYDQGFEDGRSGKRRRQGVNGVKGASAKKRQIIVNVHFVNGGGDSDGGDKSGSDKGGGDKSGSDKGGSDNGGSDKGGGDKSGSDSGGSKGGSDKGGDKGGGDNKGGCDELPTEPVRLVSRADVVAARTSSSLGLPPPMPVVFGAHRHH